VTLSDTVFIRNTSMPSLDGARRTTVIDYFARHIGRGRATSRGRSPFSDQPFRPPAT